MKSLVSSVQGESDRRYYERTLELAKAGELRARQRNPGSRSTVTDADWQDMRELRMRGWTLDQIAERLGYVKSTISRVFARKLGQEIQEAQATGRDVEAVRDLFGRRRGRRSRGATGPGRDFFPKGVDEKAERAHKECSEGRAMPTRVQGVQAIQNEMNERMGRAR